MPKVNIPDGRGGFQKVDATQMPGQQISDPARQQETFQQTAENGIWERVGAAADRFNELEKAVGTEMGLSEEEMVMAKYLDLLNWERTYPANLGGRTRFKELCLAAQQWFVSQTGK